MKLTIEIEDVADGISWEVHGNWISGIYDIDGLDGERSWSHIKGAVLRIVQEMNDNWAAEADPLYGKRITIRSGPG